MIIETFNASRDLYGNPTAHYIVWHNGAILHSNQHGRREQIGYSGRVNEVASYWLRENLGIELLTDGKHFDRNGSIEYEFIAHDMGRKSLVTLTDLYCGELNYSTVDRFIVTAKSERGIAQKMAHYTGLNFRKELVGVYHSTSKLSGFSIEPFNFDYHGELKAVEL